MGCFGICALGLFVVRSTVRFSWSFFEVCRAEAEAWGRTVGTCTSGTATLMVVVYGNSANVAVSLY